MAVVRESKTVAQILRYLYFSSDSSIIEIIKILLTVYATEE